MLFSIDYAVPPASSQPEGSLHGSQISQSAHLSSLPARTSISHLISSLLEGCLGTADSSLLDVPCPPTERPASLGIDVPVRIGFGSLYSSSLLLSLDDPYIDQGHNMI